MYFDKFQTQEEVRARYRRWAKMVHPDVGGDHEIMQEINAEYELKLAELDEEKSNPFKGYHNSDPFRQPKKHVYEPPKQKPNPARSDNMDSIIKVKAVLAWAQEHPSFDTAFMESLSERLLEGRSLTEGQSTSLNNIIKRFKINIQEWS